MFYAFKLEAMTLRDISILKWVQNVLRTVPLIVPTAQGGIYIHRDVTKSDIFPLFWILLCSP